MTRSSTLALALFRLVVGGDGADIDNHNHEAA
jgi:hypothetical protein